MKIKQYGRSEIINVLSEILSDGIRFTDAQIEKPKWSLEKKQLLIDSIINQYSIGSMLASYDIVSNRYEILDGKTRLEVIQEFKDDKFQLAADFNFKQDDRVKAGNMYYSKAAPMFPILHSKINSYRLNITVVDGKPSEIKTQMERLGLSVLVVPRIHEEEMEGLSSLFG